MLKAISLMITPMPGKNHYCDKKNAILPLFLFKIERMLLSTFKGDNLKK